MFFLENRQTLDAVGVAQEIFHSIKTKNMLNMVLKMDLVKYYDWVYWGVYWGFLKPILLQIGLDLASTKWIMDCVQSVNYVVLINDSPTKFFRVSKGVSHGCPLSPLLY